MRLINANKLTPDRLTDFGVAVSINQIDNAETINAIPIPDNATNGDMIRVAYGVEPIYGDEHFIFYGGEMRFSREWWNAPYKGGE